MRYYLFGRNFILFKLCVTAFTAIWFDSRQFTHWRWLDRNAERSDDAAVDDGCWTWRSCKIRVIVNNLLLVLHRLIVWSPFYCRLMMARRAFCFISLAQRNLLISICKVQIFLFFLLLRTIPSNEAQKKTKTKKQNKTTKTKATTSIRYVTLTKEHSQLFIDLLLNCKNTILCLLLHLPLPSLRWRRQRLLANENLPTKTMNKFFEKQSRYLRKPKKKTNYYYFFFKKNHSFTR